MTTGGSVETDGHAGPSGGRVRRDRVRLADAFAILLAVASAALVVLLGADVPVPLEAYSPQPAPDALQYVTAADAYLRGEGLRQTDGSPFSLFPPGYPLTLAWAQRLGLALPSAVLGMNAASAAALVLATYALTRVLVRRPWPAVVAAALIAPNSAVLATTQQALTEPAFNAMAAWVLVLSAWGAGRARWSPSLITAMVLLAWAAISYRYVGVLLAIPVAIARWASCRRLTAAAAAGGAVALGFAGITLWNALRGASGVGERRGSYLTFEPALNGNVEELGRLLLVPERFATSQSLGMLVLVALGVAGWLAWWRRETAPWSPLSFVAAMIAFTTASMALTHVDAPGPRLTSPLMAPAAALVVYAAFHLAGYATASLTARGVRLPRPAIAGTLAGIGLALAALQALVIVRGA